MKIASLFSEKTVFSFEIFPPKKTSPIETVYDTLEALQDLKPDFISVTFGAGGSGNGENTLAIARRPADGTSALYPLYQGADR